MPLTSHHFGGNEEHNFAAKNIFLCHDIIPGIGEV